MYKRTPFRRVDNSVLCTLRRNHSVLEGLAYFLSWIKPVLFHLIWLNGRFSRGFGSEPLLLMENFVNFVQTLGNIEQIFAWSLSFATRSLLTACYIFVVVFNRAISNFHFFIYFIILKPEIDIAMHTNANDRFVVFKRERILDILQFKHVIQPT